MKSHQTPSDALLGSLVMLALIISIPAAAEGNRYKLPRAYQADVSPAAAYLEQQRDARTVIIDVRTIGEFVAGHAPQTYSIPFPRILGTSKDDPAYVEMSAEDFLAEVSRRFPDHSTPIIAMCSHGMRSAAAANVLAKAGYTSVRSVFTGYVGRPVQDIDGTPVDANNNGVIHGVTKDADGKVLQDPGDLDGWAGFNQLPVTRDIDPSRILQRLKAEYKAQPSK